MHGAHPSANQQTTGSAAATDFAPGILASVSPIPKLRGNGITNP
jgi:hypothetical protein